MAQPSASEIQYQLNHINDDKSVQMLSSQICGMVIAFVAVALRLVSRRVGRVPILADDYMVVVALVRTTLRGYFLSRSSRKKHDHPADSVHVRSLLLGRLSPL